ncbi:hypothetical protein D1007_17716 [Hordeum vulgare]|nr:hypothetical protein D1007_17716 [Hordeum vulgare]
MADTRRACTERRPTRVAQTAPMGPAGARWSPSPMVNAAAGPDAKEKQGSFLSATERLDGRTATPSLVGAFGSASRAWPEMPHGQRALAMAAELLRYRPALDHHNGWLQSIEELVAATGDPAVLSFLFPPQPGSASPRPALRTQGEDRR